MIKMSNETKSKSMSKILSTKADIHICKTNKNPRLRWSWLLDNIPLVPVRSCVNQSVATHNTLFSFFSYLPHYDRNTVVILAVLLAIFCLLHCNHHHSSQKRNKATINQSISIFTQLDSFFQPVSHITTNKQETNKSSVMCFYGRQM